ncbi:hypothetical protein C5612_15730 [Pseudomonas frederiksbergensis]|uniref:Uncharacterized protein n=1 Tax=Pseudomonas frederiksbergensis TaxID=104087 RepID=A0A2S8HL96_9PSED|nr:hypothetical protein C5612_15730 [Pseudomonas frederiksbergensis]
MAVAALQVQALIVALLGVVFVSVTHASAVMRPTQAEPWGSKKLSDNARGFGLQRGCPMLLARPKRALIGGWGGWQGLSGERDCGLVGPLCDSHGGIIERIFSWREDRYPMSEPARMYSCACRLL